MLNPEPVSQVPTSRQEYNRRYYEKRKQQLLTKKKNGDGGNVSQLFSKVVSIESSDLSRLRNVLSWIETFALLVLVCMMTAYLIVEGAKFYLDTLESPLGAYLKAGMVEGVAILFSFTRGKSVLLRCSQRIVVALLCLLTLWTVTGRLVKSASQDLYKSQVTARVIEGLERERTLKETLQKQFLERQWLGAARKYENEVNEVRKKLDSARKELYSLQSPQVILNGLGIMIAFRFLILAANLISFHLLAEQFGGESMLKQRTSSHSKN
jgi:ABC-type multidrug transport system fused ATPase/permease subunit